VKYNLGVAVFFLVMAVANWYWPRFNGVFFETSDVTDGEGRIIAAVFAVGAAILWFMNPPKVD
jgi:hypothetical protein